MEKGLQPVSGVPSMNVSNGHNADELDETEDFAKNVLKGKESDREENVKDYAEAIEKAAKRKRMALEEIAHAHGYHFRTSKFKDEFVNKDTGRVDLIHKHNPVSGHSSFNLRTFTPEAVATQAAACFATFKENDNVYFNFKNMTDEQAVAQTKLSLSKFYEAGFDYERLILPKNPEILRVIRQDYIDALASQSVSNTNEEAIDHAQKIAKKPSQNPSDLDTSQAQRAIEEAALKVKEELVEKQKFDAHKKPLVEMP
jgi:azurin